VTKLTDWGGYFLAVACCTTAPFGSAQAAGEHAGEPAVLLALAGSLTGFDQARAAASLAMPALAAKSAAFAYPPQAEPAVQAVSLKAERTLGLAGAGQILALAHSKGSESESRLWMSSLAQASPDPRDKPGMAAEVRTDVRTDAKPAWPAPANLKPLTPVAMQPVVPATVPTAVQAPLPRGSDACAAGLAHNGVFSASQLLDRVRTNSPASSTAALAGQGKWVVDPRDGTLSQTLGRWAQEANWQISWEADRDFVIDTGLAMNGTLREAIELVMLSLAHTDYPLQAAMNSSTCTMRVSRFMDNQPR
jgi:hypothetical protein